MIWVAEIGSAHCGSKSLAFEMIRQAKFHGATIAKFQFWNDEAQAKYQKDYNPVRNCASEWAEDLADWCDHFDIEFMASLWSMESLEIARKVDMKRYKVAHFMDDMELTGSIFDDKKEIFWSGKRSYFDSPFKGIAISGGYPSYPPMESIIFDENAAYYGYSSHMHGYADALIAVAKGAQFVEKHVTMNKADTSLKDNAFALTFEEFGEMVRIGNEMVRLR